VGRTARRPARPFSWGTLSSSTMMVMMTAMTPSEKASRRAGELMRFGMGSFAGALGAAYIGAAGDAVTGRTKILRWLPMVLFPD
jgi:hypothetical protein